MNAVINTDTCIHCGLCHKVCQKNNPADLIKPVRWLEGWADPDIRSTSSSGGFGQELMRSFINKGGEVAACKLFNGKFVFSFINDADSIKPFIGSKYVKSNPVGIYKEVRAKLKSGKKVLFIGLPCQVSAMRNFIPETLQEKLYVVDLICHGSPSVHLLQESLKEYGYNINQANAVMFRKNTQFNLWVDGKKVIPQGVTDRYTLAFLRGLIYTENCYSCNYAKKERVGDLTIGDSWGTDRTEELSKGISLILCQTDKGQELIDEMDFKIEEADMKAAIANNQQLSHPSVMPEQRKEFFKHIQHGMSFNNAVGRAYPKDCIKQDIKLKLKHIGILKNE